MSAPHADERETMDRFVARQNIRHYVALLERTIDEKKRAQISTLLAEERRKQKACDGPVDRPPRTDERP
jgi:hypothetical protein